MIPSHTIVQNAIKTLIVVDKRGRHLLLRRLTALDTLRLFKAAGPVLAQNEPWLSMAGLAFSVVEIDGLPIPSPGTEPQIESLIDRLGDDGLVAVADAMKDGQETGELTPAVGNLHGTPS
jgi:hypothetical protein